MKEFNCKNGGECKDFASCKRCRLYKCLTVGIKPQGICTKLNEEQIIAFAERMKEHPGKSAVLNTAPKQKELINLIVMKNLLQIEQKVRRIRYSQTPIPEFFYTQCDTFESIFSRKLNLIELVNEFSIKPIKTVPAIFLEKARQFGPFFIRPAPVVMDLLFIFEIGKTFPFFERLDNKDRIALFSNIAMPLFVLCCSFYSVQQNCDFSPGLSEQAQKLLYSEAEKYSALLMSLVQINYGPAPGALRYVELMGLIDGLFNTGVKYRQLLTYISNVLDPNFDKVFPPVLAQIGTKGPVESHQLFPY
ncbi:hypothetical protein niasHT_011772 [Heterodera trifolii]|uniref:Nuclear receptor domain-containing protein n=1 Tax=Heterodera trifolii TaxID=157864 RepID=A0ABD2L8B8_9BILA